MKTVKALLSASLARKRRSAGALCAFALLLAVAAGAQASHLRATANSAGFDDAVGDLNPDDPDINRVDVSNDDAGYITFRIQFANRPMLPDSEGAEVALDVDENPSTGGRLFGHHGSGYEWTIAPGQSNAPRACTRGKSDGAFGGFVVDRASLTCSIEPNAVVLRINRADLDNTTGFNLSVMSYSTESDASGSRTRAHDFAPDCVSTWNYRLVGPSTNPDPLCAPEPPPDPPPPLEPPAPKCVVPKVVGTPLSVAKSKIRVRHCRPGRVTSAYSRLRAGVVAKQSRRPGLRLPNGTKIKLVISRGHH
jgi:PASTA domain-containing protein